MERGLGGEANQLHTTPQALSQDTLCTRLPKRSIDFALSAELLRHSGQYLCAAFNMLKVGPLDYSVRALSARAKNDRRDAGSGQQRRIHPSSLAAFPRLVSEYSSCFAQHSPHDRFIQRYFKWIAHHARLDRCFEGWIRCRYLLANAGNFRFDFLQCFARDGPSSNPQRALPGIPRTFLSALHHQP